MGEKSRRLINHLVRPRMSANVRQHWFAIPGRETFMKPSIFCVAVFLLFSLGCTSQGSDQLTQQETDQIRNEVKSAVDSMLAKHERLDIEGALQCFWNSPQLVVYNPDCSRSDFQAIKSSAANFSNIVAAIKLPIVREEFSVLTRDVVVCTVVGRTEVYLKSGYRIAYDPYADTFVFKKISGEWKIAYRHQSATIMTEKPRKK